jgi:hypothetical protein
MSVIAKWLGRHPAVDEKVNALFLMVVEHALKSDYRRT